MNKYKQKSTYKNDYLDGGILNIELCEEQSTTDFLTMLKKLKSISRKLKHIESAVVHHDVVHLKTNFRIYETKKDGILHAPFYRVEDIFLNIEVQSFNQKCFCRIYCSPKCYKNPLCPSFFLSFWHFSLFAQNE